MDRFVLFFEHVEQSTKEELRFLKSFEKKVSASLEERGKALSKTDFTLFDCARADTVVVQQIIAEKNLRKKLVDLGFLPGAKVFVEEKRADGSLFQLEIQGDRLQIGKVEAQSIYVNQTD